MKVLFTEECHKDGFGVFMTGGSEYKDLMDQEDHQVITELQFVSALGKFNAVIMDNDNEMIVNNMIEILKSSLPVDEQGNLCPLKSEQIKSFLDVYEDVVGDDGVMKDYLTDSLFAFHFGLLYFCHKYPFWMATNVKKLPDNIMEPLLLFFKDLAFLLVEGNHFVKYKGCPGDIYSDFAIRAMMEDVKDSLLSAHIPFPI